MTSLPGRAECCWTATAPATSYPSLAGERRVDVAVVGGGIVGLTAALRLVRAGRSVAVLEALGVGRQVTGRSTAKITTQHRLIHRDLIDRLGREKAELYVDANRTAAERIPEWIRDHRIDCDLEAKSAYAYIGPDRSHLEDLDREAEAALSLGLPADVVDRAPLPFATGGAVRFSNQAQFNPARYLIGLAGVVAGLGGEVFEHSRVTGVEGDGDWQVRTDHGGVEAKHVVVATNLPAVGPTDFSGRTQPRCHPVMAFRIGPADAPDGMFISADDPVHSIRTGHDADGLLLVVLGPPFRSGQDGDVARRFTDLERWTRERFNVGTVEWRWVNEDYDTADRLPYAGPVARGLYIATGFNAWGITNGTAAGLLVADQILDRGNSWASLYSVERPSPEGFHQSGDTQSRVSGVGEIVAGAGGVITRGGDEIAVWKDDAGGVHAVSASCTHKGCTVTWNNADRTWDCPCHGSVFAADGSVIHGPATAPLEPRSVPD